MPKCLFFSHVSGTRRWSAGLLIMLLALVVSAPAPGHARSLVPGEDEAINHADYYAADKALTLEQAIARPFKPFAHTDINQGIDSRQHWLHFYVTNPKTQQQHWVISSQTSYLDNLVVYSRNQGEREFSEQRLTDRASFTQRPLAYRTLSAPLATPPGGTTEVYLLAYHDEADSITLRFHLLTEEAFVQRERVENLLFGLFYGALVSLLLIALLFAVLLRQINALNYALFLGSTCLLWIMLNGIGFQYFWPDNAWWHNQGFHLVYLAFSFFGLQFSRCFLQLERLAPTFNRLFLLLQTLALISMALRLIGFYRPVLDIAFLLLLIQALVIPTASALVWRRGLHYAPWCLMAWLMYSMGILTCVISGYSNILPWGMSPLIYLQLACLLEAALLMIGMAQWLVHLERDRQRAIALANEDPLTGLGNRRRLQQAYENMTAAFTQHQQPIYLIMIDLDYFKRINDRYGHDAGDQVLRGLGQLLPNCCRPEDVIVRFGGEEFAILLSAPDLATVSGIADRIGTEFAASPTLYRDQIIQHTLCCGIAEVYSTELQLSSSDMMRRADAALYDAKAAGRNQNQVYQDNSSPEPV